MNRIITIPVKDSKRTISKEISSCIQCINHDEPSDKCNISKISAPEPWNIPEGCPLPKP